MKGMSQVVVNIEGLNNKTAAAAKAGLKEVATVIFEDARDNYCPVATGKLRNSGKIEDSGQSAADYKVTISFNTDYALKQHEIPYNHTHGSWKYLETPFKSHSSKIQPTVQAKVNNAS